MAEDHPLESFLRGKMIPHIWCEGCGNGIILNCFVQALKETEFDLDKVVVVSGIGCIGRYQATQTPIPFTPHMAEL